MKLINFKEQNVVFAENQPEYLPLPACQLNDPEKTIVCCWQLSWKEKLQILFTGKIWHSVLTFGQLLQPQLLEIDKPALQYKIAIHNEQAFMNQIKEN